MMVAPVLEEHLAPGAGKDEVETAAFASMTAMLGGDGFRRVISKARTRMEDMEQRLGQREGAGGNHPHRAQTHRKFHRLMCIRVYGRAAGTTTVQTTRC